MSLAAMPPMMVERTKISSEAKPYLVACGGFSLVGQEVVDRANRRAVEEYVMLGVTETDFG